MSKNEPFDCEKLIDMRADQLDSLIKECELNIECLRIDIVKTYQQAQPYLIQLTALKRQMKQTSEKMEAAKTFLSMENNGSLVSNLDIKSMEKSLERNKLLLQERSESEEPKGKKSMVHSIVEPMINPIIELRVESKREKSIVNPIVEPMVNLRVDSKREKSMVNLRVDSKREKSMVNPRVEPMVNHRVNHRVNPRVEFKREKSMVNHRVELKREKSVESSKFRSPLVDNWTKSKEMEEKRSVTKPYT